MREKMPWRDRYLLLLCVILCGYAVVGRGFASLGVPPLFVGELALGVGLFAVLAAGSYVTLFATTPSLLLAALFAWIAIQATTGFELYGIIALRDAVIVGYGAFALIVVALLCERPERLATIIRLYRGFAHWYGLLAGVVFYLAAVLWSPMPRWPGTDITLIAVRPGEAAVHLAGVGAFTLAGLRRASPLWIVMLLLGIMVVTPSRGATLACLLPLTAAVVLTGKTTRFMPYILVGAGLFALAYALDVDIVFESGRSMGPRQMVNGVLSIFGTGGENNMDNTKAWRLGWWQAIQDYTFHGQYFWTGKGFGQSLAEIDGFVVGEETGGPPLRSPHNAHMTMLARAGVPGLLLWFGTLLAWFGTLGRNMIVARSRSEPGWHGLFVWIACYLAAIVIDASFDVALEGPMLGIWFWCLFGLGIAATMIYRATIQAADTQTARTRAMMTPSPALVRRV